MFLFETVPCIVCLISCTPFHDPGTREMDRILFHGDPEKMRKALPERKDVRINP